MANSQSLYNWVTWHHNYTINTIPLFFFFVCSREKMPSLQLKVTYLWNQLIWSYCTSISTPPPPIPKKTTTVHLKLNKLSNKKKNVKCSVDWNQHGENVTFVSFKPFVTLKMGQGYVIKPSVNVHSSTEATIMQGLRVLTQILQMKETHPSSHLKQHGHDRVHDYT